MSNVVFTSEEEALLTPLNCTAYDMLRVNAKRAGKIPPCWLCCSEEEREKARDALLAAFMTTHSIATMESLEASINEAMSETNYMSKWRVMELSRKEGRENGDPRAYFMER